MINSIISKAYYPDDIRETLEKDKLLDTNKWKLDLKVSTNQDQNIKNKEDEQFKIEFQSNYNKYCKRLKIYKANLTHAYAKLWGNCSKDMQRKIVSMSIFESSIKNKLLELLSAIKKQALSFQEDQYKKRIILDSLINFVLTKQKEDECLDDYITRFKGAVDVLKEHLGGPLILTKYIKTLPDYNEDDHAAIKQCMKTGFEELTIYAFMKNLDQNKYGLIP